MCALIALVTTAFAQDSDITKFLGIPIDGTKYEIIQKLRAKGFTDAGSYSSADLVGEFNGKDVEISIVTNNNKVYRVFVADKYYCDESEIKIRFNRLCGQFERNNKYETAKEDQYIPDEEDISYEISVNSKRYEAAFYQRSAERLQYPETIEDYLLTEFTQEQIDNPTEEVQTRLLEMKIEFSRVRITDLLTNSARSVWFMIDENRGRYRILMFYDNELNRANGEDL